MENYSGGFGWFAGFFRLLSSITQLTYGIGSFVRGHLKAFLFTIGGGAFLFLPRIISFALSIPSRVEGVLISYVASLPSMQAIQFEEPAAFALYFLPVGTLLTCIAAYNVMWCGLTVYRFIKSWIPTVSG
jgi:hypothetical protein